MAHMIRPLLTLLLTVATAPPAAAQWTFTEVTASAKINHTHGYASGPAGDEWIFCTGVAAGDYDDDGWTDLFVIAGDAGPNLLYRNKGDGTFEDKASFAGVDEMMLGCGATFADYDGDGDLDLHVTAFDGQASKLYQNNGNGTFADVSGNFPLTRRNNVASSFADYDRDGDLDAFVTHWTLPKITHRPVDEHLWRNNGNGTFTDVSSTAGIVIHPNSSDSDKTFTPNFTDIDYDGWLDLAIASDFSTSHVLLNDGDGTFTNATDPTVITDQNGMGAAICDYDFDGDFDWFVSSIYEPSFGASGNRFYRNEDGVGNVFEDVTTATGTREGYWGWAVSCQDFDNDGDVDLFHANGYDNTLAQNDPNRLFVSDGAGVFTEESVARNIDAPGRSVGVVSFDYDRDGDLDIFVTYNQAAPKLFRNDGLSQNWLTVKLDGLAPNTESIGSRVIATVGSTNMAREIRAGNNFVSQDPAEAHFGLASAAVVDTLEVQWFSGGTTTFTNVPANQVLTIVEPANTCGDGTVDVGEQCDEGAANGGVSCCQVNCRIRPSGTTCRGESDLCDVAETCDGLSSTCPTDGFQSAETECRASADSCDAPEICTGSSAACPTDGFEPDTKVCRAPAGICDSAETCTGSSAVCPSDAKSTAECRPAATVCDVAETCDGVTDDCPADGVKPAGFGCRAAAGVCDLPEVCDGSNATCPTDAKSSGLCRAAAGLCDVPETCDGVSNACPTDGFVAGGTECRVTAGACDIAEFCTGTDAACPTDGFVAGGTECRAVSAACDVAESCTGIDAACPANVFVATGTECRAAVGVCDIAENCTGTAPSCPTDTFVSAGTGCRVSAGVCDLPEACDGIAAACPADTFQSSLTVCRASNGVCDPPENCTGSDAACPSDAKGTGLCRMSAGVCDPAESCDGVADDCPSDALHLGNECRASLGLCDLPEACDGVGPNCPADLLVPAATECRSSVSACDLPEECDGFDVNCPDDTGLPDTDSDSTCDALDVCPYVSDPGQEDGDADGIGDACDACNNEQASTVTDPNMKLSGLTQGPLAQRMKLKGYATFPTPITPAFDPINSGVRFAMHKIGDPRNPVVDITVPGGAYDKETKEGWVSHPAGIIHKFKSKTGVEGITKILLKLKSPAEGLVQFLIVAKDGNFPVLPTHLPLGISLAIDNVAGQCAEYEFEPTPSSLPACAAKSGNDKILCR